MTAAEPDFSIIITCYYEEQSIDEFHQRLSEAAGGLGRSYEIIFVNDGSTDGTLDKLREIFARDPRVSAVIDFYRNAGQLSAMTAGICQARGRALVFMDSDLQLDPEELPTLVREYDTGQDIVTGARKNRSDSLLRTVPSRLANVVMRRVARHPLTDFGCTFKIYDAKLIRGFEFGPFKTFRTAYVFARAQRVKEVPVTHHSRRYGSSGWSFRKLFSFYMDHLVGLSERPFQLISLVSLVFAGAIGIRLLLSWTVQFEVLPEVTPGLILNAVAISLLIQIGVLSLIGEYVMRNFLALQRYPAYVIRELLERASEYGEGAE